MHVDLSEALVSSAKGLLTLHFLVHVISPQLVGTSAVGASVGVLVGVSVGASVGAVGASVGAVGASVGA